MFTNQKYCPAWTQHLEGDLHLQILKGLLTNHVEGVAFSKVKSPVKVSDDCQWPPLVTRICRQKLADCGAWIDAGESEEEEEEEEEEEKKEEEEVGGGAAPVPAGM